MANFYEQPLKMIELKGRSNGLSKWLWLFAFRERIYDYRGFLAHCLIGERKSQIGSIKSCTLDKQLRR